MGWKRRGMESGDADAKGEICMKRKRLEGEIQDGAASNLCTNSLFTVEVGKALFDGLAKQPRWPQAGGTIHCSSKHALQRRKGRTYAMIEEQISEYRSSRAKSFERLNNFSIAVV